MQRIINFHFCSACVLIIGFGFSNQVELPASGKARAYGRYLVVPSRTTEGLGLTSWAYRVSTRDLTDELRCRNAIRNSQEFRCFKRNSGVDLYLP